MRYALVVSLLLAGVGSVLWIEGGPHPRTRGAWLLLVEILIGLRPAGAALLAVLLAVLLDNSPAAACYSGAQ